MLRQRGAFIILAALAASLPRAAARDGYRNAFDAGPGIEMVRSGFGLEAEGSHSDLADLHLDFVDQEVKISGVSTHELATRAGRLVGWVGQSLYVDASGDWDAISIECDARVSRFVSGGGGFQLTLSVEFSPGDRAHFSYVNPTGGSNRQLEITVEESQALRFTPKVIDPADGQTLRLKLEILSRGQVVRGWLNGVLSQQDTFQGQWGATVRVGIAATTRAPADELEARFDNLSVFLERKFTRGDVNQDGTIDVSDAVAILEHLFLTSTPPACASAADIDDNGQLQITDAVKLLRSLFLDDLPIPAPSPRCGFDASADDLTCSGAPACRG